MHRVVQFFVPGLPQGKGRARSFIREYEQGEKPTFGHITPKKTRAYEALIRGMAMNAKDRGDKSGPIQLLISVRKPVPVSWPIWKRELALAGGIRPTTKPDCDNIEKAVKDACNKVLWLDDCQVVQDMKSAFYYADRIGVLIEVTYLDSFPAQIKSKS